MILFLNSSTRTSDGTQTSCEKKTLNWQFRERLARKDQEVSS